MLEVIYHPLALEEFIASAKFYDTRVPGLGQDFMETVEAHILSIRADPTRFPFEILDIRRCLMRRFPFKIFFRVEQKRARILAVWHCSRRPLAWSKRLTG